ncbi:MAG TPA: Crp/Fnr family transcriptional regulator [Candidatus Udaeobacter sp.]|nr:Crp/Fnr family transcriptional regulator [Candidatus Udaeobacter sp.]
MAGTPADLIAREQDWLGPARSHGLLSRLPEPLIASLIERGHRVRHPKGAVVMSWPNAATSVLVLEGALRAYLSDEDGRQVTTRYLRPGDIFGFVREVQASLECHLEAIEQSELLMIDQDRVERLAEAKPAFALALMEELREIISSGLRAVYLRAFGTVRDRVANAILERAAVTGEIAAGRTVAGTQYELAMAAGSVREVVANVLQELKRDGLINVHRGGVVILAPERLAREANGRGWRRREYGLKSAS